MKPSRKAANDQAILDMVRLIEKRHGPGLALGEASRWTCLSEVKRLLDLGVPPDFRIPPNDVTPLMLASDPRVAELLISRGADVDALDAKGDSTLANFLLLTYPKSKATKFISALLRHGANPLSNTGAGVPLTSLAKEKYAIDMSTM